jgi:diaminopimelate decarboxylase
VTSPPFPVTAEFDDGTLLRLGGVDVETLARDHGTPLYVLDRADLVGRMRAYRAAFGAGVAVTYAAKALCVVGVLQLAAAEGLHVDVASAGELATAERAGFDPRRIALHGNNKSREELARAVQIGVGRVIVDSFDELERLDCIAAQLGRRQPILLRVTPGVAASTHAFIATGHDEAKFGFPLSVGMAHEAVARALKLDNVELRGIHCHIGSQITGVHDFAVSARVMVGLLRDVRDRHGIELQELNLGGGLGIVYRAGDEHLGVDQYAQALLGAVRGALAQAGLAVPALAVEPGRSIAGPAGITLYRVGAIKQVPEVRRWAAVDGGMSDNLRPALYGARYTVVAAGRRAAAPPAQWAIAGKHCETGDVVTPDAQLPEDLHEGDLLAVAATGAYGLSMASNYNRMPRPAMVLVDDGDVIPLVRRETINDVLSRDLPLPQPASRAD